MNSKQSNNKPSGTRVAAAAETAALRNVSPETRAAVLANANVKLVFKLQG